MHISPAPRLHIIAAPGTTATRSRSYFHRVGAIVYIAASSGKLAALLRQHGIVA